MGVNATIGNNVNIGRDCLIGAGALVVKDVTDDQFIKGPASETSSRGAKRFFKVVE
jgi:acetyltransferase-like isoleucine patch superfamily enzyme